MRLWPIFAPRSIGVFCPIRTRHHSPKVRPELGHSVLRTHRSVEVLVVTLRSQTEIGFANSGKIGTNFRTAKFRADFFFPDRLLDWRSRTLRSPEANNGLQPHRHLRARRRRARLLHRGEGDRAVEVLGQPVGLAPPRGRRAPLKVPNATTLWR